MHILIIPSEFFDDRRKPTAGIFQMDQAQLIAGKGNKVGFLALKPFFTLYELLHSIFRFKVGYISYLRLLQAIRIFCTALFSSSNTQFVVYNKNNWNIVKFQGIYSLFTSGGNVGKKKDWLKNGDTAIQKYMNEFGKPDVIHAHNILFGGMVGSFLSKKYAIPLVLTEHCSSHKMSNYSNQDLELIGEGLKGIKFINAVSPSLANLLEQKYNLAKNNVAWLPNVMDKEFENFDPSIPKDKRSFTFINVASLIPLKAQERLIQAFEVAFKRDKEVTLEIIGEGHLKERLARLIQELEMEGQIKLLGGLSRKSVLEKMKNADSLVHSSDYETFGVVLIEALSLGKPVVSTKCGGPECIINKKNGILVPLQNLVALAKGMKYMVEHIYEYSSSLIKEDLVQRFGQEKFYERIMNFYQEAIDDYNN